MKKQRSKYRRLTPLRALDLLTYLGGTSLDIVKIQHAKDMLKEHMQALLTAKRPR